MLLPLALALLAGAPADPACYTADKPADVAARVSKLDSARVQLQGGVVKVCYGRPSLRGRKIFGTQIVPWGKLWRTGANEPAMIHTTVPLTVAGVRLAPGSYSFYVVPQAKGDWQIVLNRSTKQWGIETDYPQVAKDEIARAPIKAAKLAKPVETFTMTLAGSGTAATITLAWENESATVPLAVVK